MKTTNRRREYGAQLVELALILPLALLLVLLVTEGAGMVRAYQVVDNAAREGARLSSLQQNKLPGCVSGDLDCSCDDACVLDQLTGAVQRYAEQNGLKPAKLAVVVNQACGVPTTGGIPNTCEACPGPSCAMTASKVSLTYEYDFTFLPRLPGLGFTPNVTLTADSVFRNMY